MITNHFRGNCLKSWKLKTFKDMAVKVVVRKGKEQKGRIYSPLIMYNVGIYTRWRPPQWCVASLGGGHRSDLAHAGELNSGRGTCISH